MYAVLDQGSTLHKLVVFDAQGCVIDAASSPGPELTENEFGRGFSANEVALISDDLLASMRARHGQKICALGLANQGETVAAWSRKTGKPLAHCISWQCHKSSPVLQNLLPHHERIREITGLVPSAYFSAPKMTWLLQNAPAVRAAATSGDLLMGTLDTWMIWRWSGGKTFITDPTTACRTLLYDIHKREWSDELLRLFGIPRQVLADIVPNNNPSIRLDQGIFAGKDLPLAASLCDQPAGLIGHGGLKKSLLKICFGTGAFIDLSLPDGSPSLLVRGLLSSVLFAPSSTQQYIYVEGGVLSFGSALEWVRRTYGVDAHDAALLALDQDTGIFCLPALAGLGAPHFDSSARTRYWGASDKTPALTLAIATLQGLVFRLAEIIDVMAAATTLPEIILVDGGLSRCAPLMQYVSNVLQRRITATDDAEMTARGVYEIMRQNFWVSAPSHADIMQISAPANDTPPSWKPQNISVRGLYKKWKEVLRTHRRYE